MLIKRKEQRSFFIKIHKKIYPLGEKSYKTFYREDGYYMLKRIVIANDEKLLDTITIVDDENNTYQIEEFLDYIGKLIIYI